MKNRQVCGDAIGYRLKVPARPACSDPWLWLWVALLPMPGLKQDPLGSGSYNPLSDKAGGQFLLGRVQYKHEEVGLGVALGVLWLCFVLVSRIALGKRNSNFRGHLVEKGRQESEGQKGYGRLHIQHPSVQSQRPSRPYLEAPFSQLQCSKRCGPVLGQPHE